MGIAVEGTQRCHLNRAAVEMLLEAVATVAIGFHAQADDMSVQQVGKTLMMQHQLQHASNLAQDAVLDQAKSYL